MEDPEIKLAENRECRTLSMRFIAVPWRFGLCPKVLNGTLNAYAETAYSS